MKAVVLLFTKKDAEDSENFPFPNLTQVDVTVEENPNDIYSRGLAKRDMYREAVRFFNSDDCEKYLGTTRVSRRKYNTDKFACVIDFRTVNDNTISGSGRKLIGTQAGILMEIEKEATPTDLSCHVLVIADGASELVKLGFSGRHIGLSAIVVTLQLTPIAKPYRMNISKVVTFYNACKGDMKYIFNNFLNIEKDEEKRIIDTLKNNDYARLEILTTNAFQTKSGYSKVFFSRFFPVFCGIFIFFPKNPVFLLKNAGRAQCQQIF